MSLSRDRNQITRRKNHTQTFPNNKIYYDSTSDSSRGFRCGVSVESGIRCASLECRSPTLNGTARHRNAGRRAAALIVILFKTPLKIVMLVRDSLYVSDLIVI